MTGKPKEDGHPQIYSLMGKILGEVESIQKTRRNNEQGYAFRGIDEVYAAIHPLFAKYGVFILPRVLEKESSERVTAKGTILRFTELKIAYDFCAPDGSIVTAEVVGEAMDSGDKSSNKAMSAGQKYAILQTFCIPTGDTPDADATTQDELKPAVKCPECQGAMWDNRESKRNPKAPDYKCKNKACNGAVWEDTKSDTPESTKSPSDAPTESGAVLAFREQIKGAAQALNDGGDVDEKGEPKWTVQSINSLAREHFDGPVATLGEKHLGELAEMFSQRLEAMRKGATERRKNIIASIESAPDADIQAYLKQHHDGKSLEELTTAELVKAENELTVPF